VVGGRTEETSERSVSTKPREKESVLADSGREGEMGRSLSWQTPGREGEMGRSLSHRSKPVRGTRCLPLQLVDDLGCGGCKRKGAKESVFGRLGVGRSKRAAGGAGVKEKARSHGSMAEVLDAVFEFLIGVKQWG
jgi:hypothetical protein